MYEAAGPAPGSLGSRGCCLLSSLTLGASDVWTSWSCSGRPFLCPCLADHEDSYQRE